MGSTEARAGEGDVDMSNGGGGGAMETSAGGIGGGCAKDIPPDWKEGGTLGLVNDAELIVLHPVEDAGARVASTGAVTDAQPAFLKPPLVSFVELETFAHPDGLNPDGLSTTGLTTGARAGAPLAGRVDLAILIPLAAAIFLSSFSSRFLSFSFRLSSSSCGIILAFACMSLKRAL